MRPHCLICCSRANPRAAETSAALSPKRQWKLLRALTVGMVMISSAAAQTGSTPRPSGSAAVKPQPAKPAGTTTIHTTALTARARNHYQLFWGIDSPEVKAVESGMMIRFSYLVVDADKASLLNDKKLTPKLIDQEAKVSLEVPSVDQVGQLRQGGTPESGRAYWIIFSNKRREVKPGDRISIVIGKFRADGLYVQ